MITKRLSLVVAIALILIVCCGFTEKSPFGSPPVSSSSVTTALGYTPAHSGANSDITSLTGLSTPLSVAQGGSGTTGSALGGTPFSNGSTRGSELAPAFAVSPNYTTIVHGSTLTEAAGTMTAAGASTGVVTFAPTTALTPVANYMYQITAILSSGSAGTWTPTFGGTSGPTITAAAGTFVWYCLATNTNNLLVTLGGNGVTNTMVFTSISVKQVGSYPNPKYIVGTNNGDTGARTVYLPSATAGMDFFEMAVAAQVITVKPISTDDIYVGTTAYATALTFGAVRQTYVLLRCLVGGHWDQLGVNGSVTPS